MLPVQFSYLMATRGGRKGGEGGGGWASLTLPTTPNLQVLASIRKTFCQSCTATANKVFFFVERNSTNETRALHNMLFIFFYGDHKPSPSPRLSPIAPTISISINQVIHKIRGRLTFTEEPRALHQRSGSLFIVHAETGD